MNQVRKKKDLVLARKGLYLTGRVDSYVISWRKSKGLKTRIEIDQLLNTRHYGYRPVYNRDIYGELGCEEGIEALKGFFRKRRIDLTVEFVNLKGEAA